MNIIFSKIQLSYFDASKGVKISSAVDVFHINRSFSEALG
jgi:hypothetical protein